MNAEEAVVDPRAVQPAGREAAIIRIQRLFRAFRFGRFGRQGARQRHPELRENFESGKELWLRSWFMFFLANALLFDIPKKSRPDLQNPRRASAVFRLEYYRSESD